MSFIEKTRKDLETLESYIKGALRSLEAADSALEFLKSNDISIDYPELERDICENIMNSYAWRIK